MGKAWDDCPTWIQAQILAFDQVCQHDEMEEKMSLAGAKPALGGGDGRPSPKREGRRKKGKR